MYKGTKLRPCPKCGHEEGLINCPVCHTGIELVIDEPWKVWIQPSDEEVMNFIDTWAQDYANDDWRSLPASQQMAEARLMLLKIS